jgi:hypothetical protein
MNFVCALVLVISIVFHTNTNVMFYTYLLKYIHNYMLFTCSPLPLGKGFLQPTLAWINTLELTCAAVSLLYCEHIGNNVHTSACGPPQ